MKYLFLLLSFAIFQASIAQEYRTIFGFFPEASLSYKISDDYSVTHKIESQNGLYDTQNLNEEFEYEQVLTDLQTFVGRRLSPFVKVDIGYQYRLQEGENTHRPIQQISILQRESFYRIGHRIRYTTLYRWISWGWFAVAGRSGVASRGRVVEARSGRTAGAGVRGSTGPDCPSSVSFVRC